MANTCVRTYLSNKVLHFPDSMLSILRLQGCWRLPSPRSLPRVRHLCFPASLAQCQLFLSLGYLSCDGNGCGAVLVVALMLVLLVVVEEFVVVFGVQANCAGFQIVVNA